MPRKFRNLTKKLIVSGNFEAIIEPEKSFFYK